jgi:dTDP-4-dehydrorhamnose reductase
MIVAVLGANGQLGSDFVCAAQADNRGLEALPLFRKDLDVCDLRSISPALSRHRFDVLVNCTSYHKTDEVEEHASEAFRINAHAVGAMAKACKTLGARFVHISSDYVFDGGSRRPYTETDYASPLNVYGASKLLGEKFALREYGDGTLIVRVASLFGAAGSSGKGGNFVETILRRGREAGEVRVVDDITMSPTYTADAARVILTLLQNNAPPGIYHVVNAGSATWFEFARQILEEAGIQTKAVPLTSKEYPTVALRPAYTVLDNRKASQIVGEIPHWKQALRQYLLEKGHLRLAQPSSQSWSGSSNYTSA